MFEGGGRLAASIFETHCFAMLLRMRPVYVVAVGG